MLSAPRVCGDDPGNVQTLYTGGDVLPAYAGMIPTIMTLAICHKQCSPRMRG